LKYLDDCNHRHRFQNPITAQPHSFPLPSRGPPFDSRSPHINKRANSSSMMLRITFLVSLTVLLFSFAKYYMVSCFHSFIVIFAKIYINRRKIETEALLAPRAPCNRIFVSPCTHDLNYFKGILYRVDKVCGLCTGISAFVPTIPPYVLKS